MLNEIERKQIEEGNYNAFRKFVIEPQSFEDVKAEAFEEQNIAYKMSDDEYIDTLEVMGEYTDLLRDLEISTVYENDAYIEFITRLSEIEELYEEQDREEGNHFMEYKK